MKLTLIHRRPETANVESFLFRPEAKLSFIPGQYLRWTLPHRQPDDRGTWRFFSIASSPNEEYIQLTTKFTTQHGSSFKTALHSLKTGDQVNATGPMGQFVLDESYNQPITLVAGGIGITPYRSMIADMHLSGHYRPFHLIYACRTPADAIFKPLLLEATNSYQEAVITYVYEDAQGQTGDGVTQGRLTAHKLYELEPRSQAGAIYLSGPQPMVEGLKQQLLELGQPTDTIKTDFFPGYQEI